MVASMGMLGAVLAQIVSDVLHRRRAMNETIATTTSVLRSMISDLDYCACFLCISADQLQAIKGEIAPRQIQFSFQAYAHQHFDVKHLIMTGLYHRYQKPIGFAERLSSLWGDENEYHVDDTMTAEIIHWARYCAYLAGAIEDVIDRPGWGNIEDFSDYSAEKVDNRLRKLNYVNHEQVRDKPKWEKP
jgi:hypothetical protein